MELKVYLQKESVLDAKRVRIKKNDGPFLQVKNTRNTASLLTT